MADTISMPNGTTEPTNYGPVWTAASFGFFALTHTLLKSITPKSALGSTSQAWKWRNVANSLVHSAVTGIWAVLRYERLSNNH